MPKQALLATICKNMPIENETTLFTIASLAFLAAVLFTLFQRTREIQRGHAETPLSDRMEKAVHYFRGDKTRKKITNDIYQELTRVSHATASRDLQKLEELGFLEQRGESRGTYYTVTSKTTAHLKTHTSKI